MFRSDTKQGVTGNNTKNWKETTTPAPRLEPPKGDNGDRLSRFCLPDEDPRSSILPPAAVPR
jgi:hypothetical protein